MDPKQYRQQLEEIFNVLGREEALKRGKVERQEFSGKTIIVTWEIIYPVLRPMFYVTLETGHYKVFQQGHDTLAEADKTYEFLFRKYVIEEAAKALGVKI